MDQSGVNFKHSFSRLFLTYACAYVYGNNFFKKGTILIILKN